MTNLVKFGVEEEFFLIGNEDERCGKLQKKFLEKFANIFSYRIVHTDAIDGLPIQVNRDFETGYVAIKFDSTFNTLEIAYPPFNSLSEFKHFAEMVWHSVQVALLDTSLEIKKIGYLNLDVSEVDFFAKGSVQKTLMRPHSMKPFFDRFYPAKICSTQIHLQVDPKNIFPKLNSYYFFEPLIQLLFSNSNQGHNKNCFRMQVLQDAFLDSYMFFGFPEHIASSEEQYRGLLSQADGFWRDYSLIVPREHGTWEFRSACVQPNLSSLFELLEFRLAVNEIVSNIDLKFDNNSVAHIRTIYLESLRTTNSKVINEYLATIKNHALFSMFPHSIKRKVLDLMRFQQYQKKEIA